jgi:hypothetical protein
MTKKKVMMIDPPSGWLYGFPKVLPDPKPESMHEWLVGNGYPQEEIDKMKEYFYCRYWETELDINSGEEYTK